MNQYRQGDVKVHRDPWASRDAEMARQDRIMTRGVVLVLVLVATVVLLVWQVVALPR